MLEEQVQLIPPEDGWRWEASYRGLDEYLDVYVAPLDPPPFHPHTLLCEMGKCAEAGFRWVKDVKREGGVILSAPPYVRGYSMYEIEGCILRVAWAAYPDDGYQLRPIHATLAGPNPPLPLGKGQKKEALAFAKGCLPTLERVRSVLGLKEVSLDVVAKTRAGTGGWKPALRRYRYIFDGALRDLNKKEVAA